MNCNTGYIVTSIASILSILACSFINYLILWKKELRAKKEYKLLVIFLTIYILLYLSSLIPYYDGDEHMCNAQGFLIQLFSLSGVLWTGYIGLYRFLQFKEYRDPCNYMIMLIIIFLFSLFTAIFPIARGDNYKKGYTWCWFGTIDIICDGENYGFDFGDYTDELKQRVTIYVYAFYYVIFWTVIAWIIFVYAYMHFKSRSMGAEPRRFKWFKYYPLVLLICFIPLTIFRALSSQGVFLFTNRNSYIGLIIFSATVLRLLGFFNALVYGFNSETRNMISMYWNNHPEVEMHGSARKIEIADQTIS